MRPVFASTCSTAALTDAELDTSIRTPKEPLPSAAASCSAPSKFKSATATVAPASARRLQIASPIPVAPPVTIAVCPVRSNGIRSGLASHVDGDLGRNVAVQTDGYLVLAERPDGILKLDLAAVYGVVLSRQPVRDVVGRDGAEELIVLAGLAGDVNGDRAEQLGEI